MDHGVERKKLRFAHVQKETIVVSSGTIIKETDILAALARLRRKVRVHLDSFTQGAARRLAVPWATYISLLQGFEMACG